VPAIMYRNLKVQVDDEGYLVNFDDWNEEIARAIAEREGVSHECPLTQEKIDILRFMREYYKKHNSFPLLKAVCKKISINRKIVPTSSFLIRLRHGRLPDFQNPLPRCLLTLDTTLDPGSCL
jgi:TusE/DsrC/DsvC family sulfur relay protein